MVVFFADFLTDLEADADFFALDVDIFCDFLLDFRPDFGVTGCFSESKLGETLLPGVFTSADCFPLCDLVPDADRFVFDFGVVDLVFDLGVDGFVLEGVELSDLEEVILPAFSSVSSSILPRLRDDNFFVLAGDFPRDFLPDLEVDLGVTALFFVELSALPPLLLGVFLSASSKSNSRFLEAGDAVSLDFLADTLRADFLVEVDFELEREPFDLDFLGDNFGDLLFGVSSEVSSFAVLFPVRLFSALLVLALPPRVKSLPLSESSTSSSSSSSSTATAPFQVRVVFPCRTGEGLLLLDRMDLALGVFCGDGDLAALLFVAERTAFLPRFTPARRVDAGLPAADAFDRLTELFTKLFPAFLGDTLKLVLPACRLLRFAAGFSGDSSLSSSETFLFRLRVVLTWDFAFFPGDGNFLPLGDDMLVFLPLCETSLDSSASLNAKLLNAPLEPLR